MKKRHTCAACSKRRMCEIVVIKHGLSFGSWVCGECRKVMDVRKGEALTAPINRMVSKYISDFLVL